MRCKPKDFLQTTLELLSSNDSIYNNIKNNNIHNNQTTHLNIKHLTNNSSFNNNIPSTLSHQDNITNDGDNYNYYHDIINHINKDIVNINQKLLNIETSGFSTSRYPSDLENVNCTIKNKEFNNIIKHNDSLRNNSSTYSNRKKESVTKIPNDYKIISANKKKKLKELEHNNKLLLDKNIHLENKIQFLKQNSHLKINNTNNGNESLRVIIIKRPHSSKNIIHSNNKSPKIIAYKKKSICSKKEINTNNKREITKNKVIGYNTNYSKRKCKTPSKIKQDKINSNFTNENSNYKHYLNQLKDIINNNNYANKNQVLFLLQLIEKTFEHNIKKINTQHKKEIKQNLQMILQLEEENSQLKQKVYKIKKITN
jgi:hypothetical protein